MKTWRDLGVLGAILIVAGIVLPLRLGDPDLGRTATALTLAGACAGAALSLAVGRPNLAVGALAGVGAYVSGALAVRGVNVPIAVLLAVVASGGAGALIAMTTARLDRVGLLAATLLIAVGLAALVQALPQLSGGEAGLGPLPPLGTRLPDGHLLQLTPSGDLHALLLTTFAVTAAAALLLRGRLGALWRAVGSDRNRASGSGIQPLRVEITALAVGGALAGLGGALGAHVNGVATPVLLSADSVALPLLAALYAGRGNAVGAVVAGVVTGLVGNVLLPDFGWHGPPSANALAIALLGIVVIASLLPGQARPRRARSYAIPADEPWPFAEGEFAGADLIVDRLDVRAGRLDLIRGFSLRAQAGRIHGLVGPNGSGKSTILAAIASVRSNDVRLEGGTGGVALQPQSGGGFPACTVDETLYLAARGGGRGSADAQLATARWRQRLALDSDASTLCADLSAGRRRLLDLARVLLRRPAVLLCDEPLAGLDAGTRAAAVSLLRAAADAGLTIVLAEHDRAAVTALAALTTELRRADAAVLARPLHE